MSGLPSYEFVYFLNLPKLCGREMKSLFDRWFYADTAGEANGLAWKLHRMGSCKYRNLRKRTK